MKSLLYNITKQKRVASTFFFCHLQYLLNIYLQINSADAKTYYLCTVAACRLMSILRDCLVTVH
jgi:hypothetical protein